MALLPNPNREYEKLKAAAKAARRPYEIDAWLNLAFYLDEQYVRWDPTINTIRRIERDPKNPNAPRPIFNKIMHYVQQEVAMVLQAKPNPDVLPATDDIMDMSGAAVAKAYLDWIGDPTQVNFDRQLKRAVLWAIICGDGFLKWPYDPKEGRPGCVPVSFFDLYRDPYAKTFDQCRYLIHTQFMDSEQVEDIWGVKVSPDTNQRADPMKTELLAGMGAAPVLTGVEVNELWYKPCKRYPDGQYVVWTGRQQLVAPTALPYKHQRLPFTQIGCIERPDSSYYMSPVKYLRSAQMVYNKLWAQRLAIRQNFANPKWFIPPELDLVEDPNDAPNQVLKSNPGTAAPPGVKPELIQPTTMPGNDDLEQMETQMMHIVGLHEVSQAQVPGRVEAAKAIELLKESDADRQATMLDTINTAFAEGCYQMLMLAKQYQNGPIMVQTYSREGVPEVKRFLAENLKPGLRVRTMMGTGLARSRAARNDLLMEMWQNGILRDPDLMAELMDMPIPTFVNHKAADIRLARNENLEIAKGVAITPNSWDDHGIHLREHNTYRKTNEYAMLGNDAKQKFEFHCQTHETLQMEQLQKQAQVAQLEAIINGAAPPQQGAAKQNQVAADLQNAQTQA